MSYPPCEKCTAEAGEPCDEGCETVSDDRNPCPECGSLSLLVMGPRQRLVFLDVFRERERQDEKWGRSIHRNLTDHNWLTILGEEFGEACQAALQQSPGDKKDLRAELIQVAAVAIAHVERLDHVRRSRHSGVSSGQPFESIGGS